MEKHGRQERINSRPVEVEGKTVEKALEKALKDLGSKIEDVDIEIIDPGQKGVLGIFGARSARVKVSMKNGSKGIEEVADEVTGLIMKGLDVGYRIFSDTIDDSTYINIETAGVDGLLIGRKGDTLNSLQHLIGRIVSRKMGGYQRLTVDVGGYLKNRQEILRQKAEKAAERAKKTQREVGIEPMKASERRIIHMTLAGMEGITTYTVGNGEMRKVFVSADKGRERKSNRSGRK
ncbi:MAG: Jag N-terminal domain-containing protein [Candidatus Krumholzibacteriota bacterium]|nr:Jag N-terminal domain-containing protein [Candidatus Krumholzibacteriota bacterium]